MDGWNVTPERENRYIIMNEDETVLRISKRVPNIAVPQLLSEMEELHVPIAFTRELKEIYITVLPNVYGDYFSDKIRLSYSAEGRKILGRTLIHELGHHIDVIEGISDEPNILKERKNKSRFIEDIDARRRDDEYVAVGFETFYLGTSEEKAKMRRHNRQLFEAIARVHRRYRRR